MVVYNNNTKKKSILTHTTPLSVIFCLFIHVRQLLTTIKLQNVSGIHQKQQFATTFSLINNNDTNLMNSNFLLNYIIIVPLDEYDNTPRHDDKKRRDFRTEIRFLQCLLLLWLRWRDDKGHGRKLEEKEAHFNTVWRKVFYYTRHRF